jgi:glycosyltransferase involved in cell wall biosynthesis
MQANIESDAAVIPSVSVVIPAYNAGGTLVAALLSVLGQTTPPTEIIVVDDGSTDDTAAILKQFGDQVKAVHQKNGGLAVSRAAGIAIAKGDFIALFDADDICEPERLAVQLAYMTLHPDVLLVGTDFSAFDEQGVMSSSFAQSYYGAFSRYPQGLQGIFPAQEYFRYPGDETPPGFKAFRGKVYEKLVLGNFIHPPTVMFRRSALDLVGNFDTAAGSMCDWDWIMQVSKHGPIGFIAHDLLRYRISATQMSSERHRYRRAVDNIRILNRIRARDADIYNRYHREFEAKQGACCLDAADAFCEDNRLDALKWLFQGLACHHYYNGQVPRILAKMLMPSGLRNTVRQLRKKPG